MRSRGLCIHIGTGSSPGQGTNLQTLHSLKKKSRMRLEKVERGENGDAAV